MKNEKKSGPDVARESGFPYRLSYDGGWARITADLLGIGEEKVRLDLDGNTIIISATDRDRQVKTSIDLPWEAHLASKKFGSGVLNLTLERSGP